MYTSFKRMYTIRTIRNYIFSHKISKKCIEMCTFFPKMYIILYAQHTCNKGQTMVVQQPKKKESEFKKKMK